MPDLRTIYDIILSNLSSYGPKLIYFSVGSALGHRVEIKPNQNQQYPFPILDKYKGLKKVIILMDENLEYPLKIESDINLSLIDKDKLFRILTNEDTLVFAINHHQVQEVNRASFDLIQRHLNSLQSARIIMQVRKSKLFS